jgi:hypothetical protein
MNIAIRRWGMRVLGLFLLTALYACLVPDVGYVGGAYEPTGYVYGGWGPGYHVGPPPHGGMRRPEHSAPPPPRAYRPAPPSRAIPSIPSRPHAH